MDNKKNDNYYAIKIIENINAIEKYISNKTYYDFINDDELVDAVMFRFVQMIENISYISIEFKERNKHVPWGKIMGFRNGIVHDYGKTDFTIVYETATQDLKGLKSIFEELLDA